MLGNTRQALLPEAHEARIRPTRPLPDTTFPVLEGTTWSSA